MSTSDPDSTLALLIHLLVSYDHEAELARIELAEEKDLDLFHYYRKIDRSKNGFINKNDFAVFLNSYGVFMPGRISQKYFRDRRETGPRITYNDFINQLLPYSAPDLKRQCLAKSGDTETEYSQTEEKTIEAKIAAIYSTEVELSSKIQEILNSVSKDLNVDELVFGLCDELSGYLDLRKIQDFMNYHGYEFDSLGYEYLVRRLCVNQVGRISPTDFLRHFFPDKFIKSNPKPQEDPHTFKFAKKPFTISQRPASAKKAPQAFEQSPLNFAGSSIYATQPKRSLLNDEQFYSPPRPINFPDLNKISINDKIQDPIPPAQMRSDVKSYIPSSQNAPIQQNQETFHGDKLSDTRAMTDSLVTGKFPNNPGQFRTTEETQSSNRTYHEFSDNRTQPVLRNSYQGAHPLQASRIESFGITNNTDLIVRLNTNPLPSNFQNQYNTKPSTFQGQEPTTNYDYKQGFYTNPQKGETNGNLYTAGGNYPPLFSGPLKYSQPLRESDSNTNLEYRTSLNTQTNRSYLPLQTQTTQASNYNPPLRFYSPKYTRDSTQSQTSQTQNVARYSTNLEQGGVRYIQPVTQYTQVQTVQNPVYSGYNPPLESSKKGWQEKLEMSRKVTGSSAYKFSNNAYGQIWNPENEQ